MSKFSEELEDGRREFHLKVLNSFISSFYGRGLCEKWKFKLNATSAALKWVFPPPHLHISTALWKLSINTQHFSFKAFLLLLLVAYAHGQIQNLCGTAPASGFKFVDDPSACDAYLWCNFASDGTLTSVHQGTCPESFNFDDANMACSGSFVCTSKCQFNTGINRVAIPTDTECKTHTTCNDATIGTDIITCGGASVFNRNFGQCTTARIAPCGSGK